MVGDVSLPQCRIEPYNFGRVNTNEQFHMLGFTGRNEAEIYPQDAQIAKRTEY